MVWSYGQDDRTGDLLLRVPGRRLSVYIESNNLKLSDSSRLLMGDVRKSSIANSFLRLFVFSGDNQILSRPDFHGSDLANELTELESSGDYDYRDELLAHAQVDAELGHMKQAEAHYIFVSDYYEKDLETDVVTHYYLDVIGSDTIREEAIAMGTELLSEHPDNRWILTTQASLLAQDSQNALAVDLYKRLLELPNQQDDWLHNAFDCWTWMPLAELLIETDPEQAKMYLNSIINSSQGCSSSGQAIEMLAQIN